MARIITRIGSFDIDLAYAELCVAIEVARDNDDLMVFDVRDGGTLRVKPARSSSVTVLPDAEAP